MKRLRDLALGDLEVVPPSGFDGILDAGTAAKGATLAQGWLESVAQHQLPEAEWFRQAYVETHSMS